MHVTDRGAGVGLPSGRRAWALRVRRRDSVAHQVDGLAERRGWRPARVSQLGAQAQAWQQAPVRVNVVERKQRGLHALDAVVLAHGAARRARARLRRRPVHREQRAESHRAPHQRALSNRVPHTHRAQRTPQCPHAASAAERHTSPSAAFMKSRDALEHELALQIESHSVA